MSTTETTSGITSPVTESEYSALPAAPVPAPVTTANGLSVSALVLSIVSIPTGFGVLAVVGVVLAFIARTQEPAHRNLANWAIGVGFVSLFAWVVFAFIGLAAFAPLALFGLAFGG